MFSTTEGTLPTNIRARPHFDVKRFGKGGWLCSL